MIIFTLDHYENQVDRLYNTWKKSEVQLHAFIFSAIYTLDQLYKTEGLVISATSLPQKLENVDHCGGEPDRQERRSLVLV